MDNIPERVKFVRKSAHLSQVEFGARLSVTGSAISNIEAGTRAITERMKLAICKEFNVDYGWLTTGQGEMFVNTDDAQGLEIMAQDSLKGYPLNSPARMKERYDVDAQDVLAVLHKPDGAPLPLNEAWNVLESVQTLIEKKACETARTQTVADITL